MKTVLLASGIVIIITIAMAAAWLIPVNRGPSDWLKGQPAHVDEVQIQIMESFPVQVRAVAKGYLPNPCTRIDRIDVGQTTYGDFEVTLNTLASPDPCVQVLESFEESVPLNVTGCEAGTYEVRFNNPDGTQTIANFTLQTDNFLSAAGDSGFCESDDECETPMDYLIQSNCPFGSACIDNECRVVCPLSYHDPDPNVSISYQHPCNTSSDCDCGERGGRTLECVCHDGYCLSVEL